MADEEIIDARRRACAAVTEWARTQGYEDLVVTAYIVVCEVVTPAGRGVVWVTGNGGEPVDGAEEGLHRWQVRGLLGEVSEQIREGNSRHDGDD